MLLGLCPAMHHLPTVLRSHASMQLLGSRCHCCGRRRRCGRLCDLSVGAMAGAEAEIKEAPQEHEESVGSISCKLWQQFQEVIEKYGGAQQYLLHKYPGPSERAEFAQALLEYFPRSEEVEYYLFKRCPPHDNDVIVHLNDLGFGESSTTKPPPYKTVCLAVGEDIIKNSIQTKGLELSRERNCGCLCCFQCGRPCSSRAVFDVATCVVFNVSACAVFNVAARAVVNELSMWLPVRFPFGLSVVAACVAPIGMGWPALSEKVTPA